MKGAHDDPFTAQYGPLSAEFYQLTKPIDEDYPDVPYYLEALRGVKGRLLEMGAGTGRLLIPLLRRGIKIEALEPSPFMREWLLKNLKSYNLQCPILEMAAEDHAEKDGFGAIVASFGTFQLLNPRTLALKVLHNFYRNLSAKGSLFIDIDVLRPEPSRANQWTHGVTLNAGPKTKIVLGGSRNWDFVEQLENVHLRYEKWESGKLVTTELQDFSLRNYGRWEFESLLREVGFKSIDCCLDYDVNNETEMHPDVLTFCYIARK